MAEPKNRWTWEVPGFEPRRSFERDELQGSSAPHAVVQRLSVSPSTLLPRAEAPPRPSVAAKLQRLKEQVKLTAVHLVDAHLCCDPGKYVSALLPSLSTMLHLELPHINVLSKIDLIESYGKLALNLDFYTDAQDLSYLQYHLDQDPRSAKYRKLTKELCDVIDDFGIVNFTTLDIQDKESMGNLVKLIDKSSGYIFSSIDGSVVEFSKIAAAPLDWDYYRTPAVKEKYIKDDE